VGNLPAKSVRSRKKNTWGKVKTVTALRGVIGALLGCIFESPKLIILFIAADFCYNARFAYGICLLEAIKLFDHLRSSIS